MNHMLGLIISLVYYMYIHRCITTGVLPPPAPRTTNTIVIVIMNNIGLPLLSAGNKEGARCVVYGGGRFGSYAHTVYFGVKFIVIMLVGKLFVATKFLK